MPIFQWETSRSDELADFYNRSIENIPYAYPLSPEAFALSIARDMGDFDTTSIADLHSEELIVAQENGGIRGFIHVAMKDQKDHNSPMGIVRFFAYEPGWRWVGQALLEEAQTYFAERGVEKVSVFPKGYLYHFISADGGLSEKLGHVAALLASNGYDVCDRILTMAMSPIDVKEPTEPSEDFRIEADDLFVYAYLKKGPEKDKVCGESYGYGLDYLQPSEYAKGKMFIQWLVVREELRGMGLGRYLLDRTLWEARERGLESCVLCTWENNHRAILLYANAGFETLQTSLTFVKRLDLHAHQR